MLTLRHLYAGAPNTTRGEPSHVSVDPTGETDNIVFPCGRVVVVRSLSDPLSARVFSLHVGSVTCARFSNDGKLVASGDEGGNIRLWHPDTGVQKSEFDVFPGPVRDVAFSSDSKFVIVCGECRGAFVKVVKVPTGSPAGAVKGHSKRVLACDMSNGSITSASEDMSIGICAGPPVRELQHPKFLRHHQAFINDIRFSPSGSLIAAASSDRSISIIDVAKSEPVHTLTGHVGSVTGVSWISETRLVSSSNDKTCKEWTLPDATCVNTFTYGTDVMDMQVGITYCSKSSEIVSISLRPQINICESSSTTPVRTLRGHAKQIVGLAAVGSRFYTADYLGHMVAWEYDVGPSADPFFNGKGPANSVCAVAANPDVVASVGQDGKIFVTPVASLTYRKPVTVKGGGVDIAVASSGSSDFSTIMINESRLVAINSAADAVLAELKLSNDETGTAVAVKPDGSLIAIGLETSGGAGMVRFFTLSCSAFKQDGSDIKLPSAPNKLAFSPDGARIAIGAKSRRVDIYECSSRTAMKGGGVAHTARVDAINFSPDGTFVASGGMDSAVAVWAVNSDKDPLKLAAAHRNGVTGIAFTSPTSIVTSGGDSCIRSWTI